MIPVPLSALPQYRFLSIGQRGVGKTVFLTACYLDCHRDQKQQRELWLEDSNIQVRKLLDNVLVYIAKNRVYPPATLKITPLDLVLQQRCQWGQEVLGWVQWWDIPGELCHLHQPEFADLLQQADGVCLFLEAAPIVQNADNLNALNQQFQPLLSILESLVYQQRPLPLAIILTKCDQLAAHPLVWQRLQKGLHFFDIKLATSSLPYKVFYSEIPIVEKDGIFQLQLKRVSTPIFWLYSKIYQQRQPENLQEKDVFYRPTPLPRWIPSLWRNKLGNLFTQTPQWGLFLGLLVIMGILSTVLVSGLSLLQNRSPSLANPATVESLRSPGEFP